LYQICFNLIQRVFRAYGPQLAPRLRELRTSGASFDNLRGGTVAPPYPLEYEVRKRENIFMGRGGAFWRFARALVTKNGEVFF